MLKAIVFDFDGVIVDSEPIHCQAFLRVVRPLGVDFDYPTYVERYAGFDDREGLAAILNDAGLSREPERIAELIQRKAEALAAIVGEGVRPMDGAAAMIRACDKRWPLAIASGALRSDIDLMLPAVAHDLAARFDAFVTAEDVDRSKPHPATYRLAVERLDAALNRERAEPPLAPGDCLAIEDTPAGLASARDAGLRTLAVANTYPADQLDAADRIVETLAGLTADQLDAMFP